MKKLNLKMKDNTGMTYVELIVVLGILFTMAAAVLSQSSFQKRVEIKTLSNDIALQVVEAQKYAMSGKSPTIEQQTYLFDTFGPSYNWKPSYGVYFNLNIDTKSFKSLADLNNDNFFQEEQMEILSSFQITKKNYIRNLLAFYTSDPTKPQKIKDLSIVFTRPNSSPVFVSDGGILSGLDYIAVEISDPTGKVTSLVKVYPSGRIQIQ
jgi:type II secretory pathway pseudopilin PulG